MYKFLIFLVIAIIGIISYLVVKKRNRWKFIILISVLIIAALLIVGFRFTASSTLPMGSKVVESIDTSYGKAILYINGNNDSFGLAKIHRSIGFLYYYDGGTSDYVIETNEPFAAAGLGNDDSFLVGVRTNNPDIKYIVVGNHIENVIPSDTYTFNMETVKKHPEDYHTKEVVNTFALFVLDKYSENTWTIRALDQDGNLIADKLFGTGEARYID